MSDTPHTLVERLRSFAEAYPEDIFIPLTADETKAHSTIVTRASGGMGRHFAPFAVAAADEIERLQADLAARDAEIARLRAVIAELIAAEKDAIGYPCNQTDQRYALAWGAARAALAQTKEPENGVN